MRFPLVGTVLALALVTGCATRTSLTQTWSAPATSTAPMHKVLVLGAKMAQADRRALEDGMVAILAKHGVTAEPSYTVFPGDAPAREAARDAVQKAGFDGILAFTVRSVREETHWQPSPNASFWYGSGGYSPGGYGPGWDGMYEPQGYLVTDEAVTCEAALWDARADHKLVWTASTRTLNPSSGAAFVRSVSRAVVPALAKAHFIQPGGED